jgi:hypothetical protein
MNLVRNGVILEQCATGVKVTFQTGEKRMVLNALLDGDHEKQDRIIIEAKKSKDYRPAPFGGICR